MAEEEIKELAREYIDSCTKRAGFVILTENIKSDFIDLFVAGFMKCLELKAGKPKWHKVADGDLPEENHFVLVLNKQTGYEIARHAPFEEYHLDNWVTVDNRSLLPIKNNPSVIAWCEIPKYTEE